MNRTIVFDTGPIINFSMNSLLWTMFALKRKFSGDFVITQSVKKELIDVPIRGKKYQFEALRVLDLINEKVLRVVDKKEIAQKGEFLMNLANEILIAKGTPLRVVHNAEMESVAAAILLNASAVAIDERTTRMLIETPEAFANLMRHRLHTNIEIDESKLNMFKNEIKNVNIIRSVELVTVAYRMGLLNKYFIANNIVDKKAKNILLNSALWALKLNGCAVSSIEIKQIVKLER